MSTYHRLSELREQLAALAHEQWSGWMRHLFSKCPDDPRAGLIPAEWAERWLRQMNTAYADLSEAEKESDRREADRVLELAAVLLGGTPQPQDEEKKADPRVEPLPAGVDGQELPRRGQPGAVTAAERTAEGCGCINCGEAENGGYETYGVGPLCGDCWSRLESHFSAPYLPHVFVNGEPPEDDDLCRLCGDGVSATLHAPSAASGGIASSPTWQPIETVPKDGTQVWLWWDGKRRLAHWHECVNPPSIGGRFANWLPDDKGSVSATVKPTLWFPLPTAPV